ncbi:undecaprenyl-diphosphate phosphatase [candidate division WWE3 bacterium]|nr:undecaprenyl-diphosphate phosphatase [candidate division WWE3 bacterium]
MSIFQALVLGLAQGLTEFLPVSSSAHLIILPDLFGWNVSPLVFDTSLHVGTAAAILLYFFNDLVNIDKHTLKLMAISSFPVIAAGFFFGDTIESRLRTTELAGAFLLFGSVLMYFAELCYPKFRYRIERPNEKTALIIGIFQALSLLPGISRSGATVSAGMLEGLDRENAARFSFLLSIPAVLAAGGYKLLTTFDDLGEIGYSPWIVGVVASFVAGYIAINFLIKFLTRNTLKPFILYRVALVFFLIYVMFLK